MRSFVVTCSVVCGFTFILLLTAMGGVQKHSARKNVSVPCTKDVDVDAKIGAKDVYVCPGDTLSWHDKGHKWSADFGSTSPFSGGATKFDNDHATSQPVTPGLPFAVYKYNMIVDGNPVDPHVVVGGGTEGKPPHPQQQQ